MSAGGSFETYEYRPASAAELGDIAAQLDLSFWTFDLATGVLRMSEAFWRMMGFDPTSGLDLWTLILPEDRALVNAAMQEADREDRPFSYDLRLRDAQERVRVIGVDGRFQRDAAGRTERVVGTSRDVTDAREAEARARQRDARLVQTEAQLADALAIARMGGWEVDVATMLVSWSPELYRLYGLEPDPGRPTHELFFNMLLPEDHELVRQAWTTALSSPEPFEYEFRARRPDGEVRVILTRGQTIFDEQGAAQRQVGTSQDVTEARRQQAALRRSHAILEVQQDLSPDGILLVDESQGVVSSNRRFRQIWGIPDELMASGRDAWLLDHVLPSVVDPAAFTNRVQQLYIERLAVGRDEIALHDGRFFERYAAPAVSADGAYHGRLWYFRDISEHKRLEAALQAQNERLRELDRLKSTFINAVSHELRVPLTSVLGYSEFIEELLAPDAGRKPDLDQARAYLSTVQVNARRLQVLVDDLLDFALLEAGMFQLRAEPADFVRRVRESAASLRPQAAKHQQRIDLDLPATPIVAPLDGQRIDQVLVNLLANALKFTPPGAPVAVRVRGNGSRVRCEIVDAGGGIAEADMPRLFQRYGQLEAGKQRGGSGLGLYISKALVEAHGGAIGVESRLGEGATFWFELPVTCEESA